MPRWYPLGASDGPGRYRWPDGRRRDAPASRLDAEGRRQVAPTWESLVERQLREAMEEGAFDELPYQGERLPLEDDTSAGEWAMAFRMIRNAGAAPPWIEADKEVRGLFDRRDAIHARPQGAQPAKHPDRAELKPSSSRSTPRSPASMPRRRPTASTAARSTSPRSSPAWTIATPGDGRSRRDRRCPQRADHRGVPRPAERLGGSVQLLGMERARVTHRSTGLDLAWPRSWS